MTDRKPIQGWAVSVDVNGVTVLTIGHNHLSGADNIEDYADVVRNCAEHLLAFIGPEEVAADTSRIGSNIKTTL